MCCILTIFLLIGPRVALFCTWIFTDRVTLAFASPLVPILGFLFLPITTLAYVWLYVPGFGITGFSWLIVLLAFLADLGTYGGGIFGNRDRLRGQTT